MNGILGKANIYSLMFILYYGDIYYIISGKQAQKLRNKNTKQLHRTAQGGEFNTNYKIGLEIVLPELDATKIIMCNFHVDYLQGPFRYKIILGNDVLSKLSIDFFFSGNTIRVNGGTYKGCTSPMKDISKFIFSFSSNWIK